MMQGLKSKKSYLVYTLYDNNKLPLNTQKILLNKKNSNPVFAIATTDGFLKVMVIGSREKVIPGNLYATITEQNSFSGQVAGDFNLSAYGDCQSGGDDFGGRDSTACYTSDGIATAAAFTWYLVADRETIRELLTIGIKQMKPFLKTPIIIERHLITISFLQAAVLNIMQCHRPKW